MCTMDLTETRYEVAVVGGGSAGVGAAVAAAQNGARTLLIERDSFPGGDLISGLPILGCCNSLGEWIVGGGDQRVADGVQDTGRLSGAASVTGGPSGVSAWTPRCSG